ncbi:uncharacterized protein K02A2.6-like [Ornithodoros turicata]|uniref:uncharacterized protein K02A2.6-like n=1 Tax=Ornithodoros turicata TaxID=34597 RepID=UPI003139BC7F
MKTVARSHIWWETLERDIVAKVQGCTVCQEWQRESKPVSLKPWPFPEKPWSRLHVDFAGPFKSHYFFIVVDAFSKWVEAEVVSSPSAEATVSCLRSIFARHGLPDVIVSDNGPAFVSGAYADFLNRNGVRRLLFPPYHPASNGAAERVVQTLKNKLKKTSTGDYKTQLARALFSYRTTAHELTGLSPAELLYGRKLKTAMDLLHPNLRDKVSRKQLYSKLHHDRNARMPSDYEPGDAVFARNFRPGPPWVPAVVTRTSRSQSAVVQRPGGLTWTRHQDHLRRGSQEASTEHLRGSEGTSEPTSEHTTPQPHVLEQSPSSATGLPVGLPPPPDQGSRSIPEQSQSGSSVTPEGTSEDRTATPPLRRSSRVRRPVVKYSA